MSIQDKIAIDAVGLSKSYVDGNSSFLALNDVSIKIRSGELALLIGPSGSGKTTLLSILGCILRPTKGTVKICGRDVGECGEDSLPGIRLKHIGFVFQGFNLFSTLTAGENVELALDLKGVRGAKARKAGMEALAKVGLEEKYFSYPSDMSGGQKQRVAIARALATDPDVILADEPTAALDWQSGKVVMDIIRRLASEEGKAAVIVSHDVRTLDYADRTIHIDGGEIKSERNSTGRS